MCEDEDTAEICERSETKCAAQIITKGEERRNEWNQAAVIRDAVRNCAHRMLAHAIADVATRLGRSELAATMDVGEV